MTLSLFLSQSKSTDVFGERGRVEGGGGGGGPILPKLYGFSIVIFIR